MGEAFMGYHPDQLIRDYNDRGMMKWLGFYLSEHTSEMEKDDRHRKTVVQRKPAMTESEIAVILETAFLSGNPVSIQQACLNNEGQAEPDLVGEIIGFEDNELFISDIHGEIQLLALTEINHVTLLAQAKWSDVS